MASGIVSVSRITNANVYLDGVGLLGRAEEFELALPKAKMVEHKGLGMAGMPEFPTGFDKLEAKIKWISTYPEVLAASSVFSTHAFQVRASMESYTSQGLTEQVPVLGLMTAMFKDSGPLNFKQHEQVDYPSTLAVYHCELYIAGVQYVLYDVMSNQYIVAGVDQLAQFRANLGQ